MYASIVHGVLMIKFSANGRVLREFDVARIEATHELLSVRLQITRAERELKHQAERQDYLIQRLNDLQSVAEEVYWQRLLRWATTGAL
jgi:hypothetical protein